MLYAGQLPSTTFGICGQHILDLSQLFHHVFISLLYVYPVFLYQLFDLVVLSCHLTVDIVQFEQNCLHFILMGRRKSLLLGNVVNKYRSVIDLPRSPSPQLLGRSSVMCRCH